MTAIDDLLKKRNIQYNSPSSSSGGSPIDNLYASLESGTYAEKRKSFFETPAQKDYTGIHADFRPQKSEEPKIEQKLKDTKISNVWNSIKQKSKQAPGALRMGLGTLIESGAKADDFLGGLIIKGFNKTFGTELQKKENILGEAGQVMRGIDFEKNMQLEDIYQKTRPESSGMARKVEDIAGSLPGTAVSLGTYGVTLALTKNPALAATAGFGTGYSQAASEIYTEARYEGLNDSDANFYASIGAPIVGAIDAIPWTNMTPQGQMTKKAVKSTLTKYLLMEMKSIGLQTLEEGTTEAVQEVVQNAVARMYNENKSLMEGVPESFIVGGILGGVTDVTMDATVGSVNYIANRPQNEPVADTVRYLQQVNSNIDKIMNKDVKKRTPQEQQIVDELLTVEISPEEAMAYIIENDLGNNPIGKQTIQQVLRAMDINRTFASELQANLDQAIPAQSNVLSSQAVRVNNRFASELSNQIDQLPQSMTGTRLPQGTQQQPTLQMSPIKKQKAIQIKPNEETGQVEIEVVDNKESIAEMMGLVREAISAGDIAAGRALYEGIVGNKPAFNTIVDEVNYKQKTEENRQKAETNKVIREQFGDETISKINRLKAVARGKDAKSGDIETLRNKNGELTESVIEAVREIPQYENMTDEEALQVALTLPVQAETKAKRVEKPILLEKGSNQQTKSREGVGDQRQARAGSVGQSTETTRGTETKSETEVDLLKGIEDDIDYDTAYIAYSGVSFYPERRAKSEIEGYVSQMKEDYEYLRKGIKDAEDEKIFKQGFRRYRENYKKRYLNYLNAKSRTMSSMIAGPANFPVKRNQSRLNIEQGHLDELIKFREKVLSRIKNDMNPTQIRGVGDKQLEQLETKLNNLKERQQMMKDVNKIIRSKKDVKNKIIERTGLKESTVDEIMKPDFAGRVGFPTYELTNNNANIKRLEGRVAEMKKKISNLDKPPIEHEFSDLIVNGEKFEGVDGTMVKNYAEDRYQLLFNSKPDSKVRTALKKHGFRWSPKNTAWQRQISNNANYTMRQYFGVDFKQLESNQETQVVEDIPEIKIQKTDETDTIAPAKQEVIEEPIEIEEPVEIEKVVEKPAQQKPVGTGEKRKSRAYKRVRDLLEADAQLSNVDYNALNLEQDAQNAIDYIARDQDSAMQVALGLKQPPRGQTETAISIALADKLRMEGDHVTASKLEASRSLRQTRRGQEIVSERGRFNDDSPYRYVQELVNRRLYELGGKVSKAKETVSRNNKGVKQDAVNQIDTEAQAIKEILLKKQSKMEKIRQAQKIIDDLKC